MVSRRDVLVSAVATAVFGVSPLGVRAGTTPTSPQARYGWLPDLPGRDDGGFAGQFNTPRIREALPKQVDLSAMFPPIYNQGNINSCTANAIAAAVQYVRRRSNKKLDFTASRLFIYYYGRKRADIVYVDLGERIADGIRVVTEMGYPPEDRWPYDDSIAADDNTHAFPDRSRPVLEPSKDVVSEAYQYRAISRSKIDNPSIVNLQSILARGFPIVFGFTVYSNFTRDVKLLNRPGESDYTLGSGHAVVAVGYDSNKKTFKIRNSWGPEAHDGGYFEIEDNYLTDSTLSANFWVIFETAGMIMSVPQQ